MESTVLSVSKFVLDGALGYAKSAVAEEVALQLGVRRHQAFVRDELEMMQAFLMAAHEERDEHRVVATWVKQVRDVAYDVEDCLQDFAVRLGRHCSCSWWRVPRALIVRRRVSAQMKELRARVEDVSQRNERYRLIKGSGSMIAAAAGQSSSSMPAATMSGVDEARRQQNRAKVDLIRLINRKDEDLGVIAVWGAGSVLEDTPIIRTAYDYLKRNRMFECYAWTRVMRPFNPTEFLRNIIGQFYIDSLEEDAATTRQASTPGAQDLRRMGIMKQDDLLHEFKKYIDMKSYMIVLCDMSTIEEWDQIKACFPNNNKGSRLLVCTQKVEVASLCVGPETVLPEHKQLSTNQTLYAFYEKESQDGTDSAVLGASLNKATTGSIHSTGGKRFVPMDNAAVVTYKESRLIGREKEKSEIIKLILGKGSQQREVISVCGMGGLGKTTLVKDVYQSQELSVMFEKRACATIKHPFHLEELISSLAMQLDEMSYRNEVTDVDRTKLGVKPSFAGSLEGKKYLIVLDDLSSTTEWDAIIEHFPITETASRITVTTRVESVAKHCSKKYQNIYMLKSLRDKDARDLFTEKVFENITDLDEQYPELVEEAKLILKKCNGLPLAIVTIGGFLEKQPKTHMEWRKLNENISAELEMNPELGMIKNVLLKSYDGLPYYLKSCFLYLSIFPAGYKVGRRRLTRRWTAEGYSKEIRGKSAEEIASSYFMELIGRRMVLPSQRYIYISKGIGCCQVHDLMHEIAISKSTEENLVFTLEEGCRSNTCGIVRHLAINGNWKGDKNEFESMVDLSRIRSLTMFGKWQPFFLSNKMRLLRVLDLEDTLGLLDYHLEHIGKLLHLVYLSLRGCEGIFHLPGSVGNLRQLQTLDVLGTRIIKLPRTIIKLRKLRNIRSGSLGIFNAGFYEEFVKDKPRLMQNKHQPQLMSDTVETDGIPNRHDVCNICCCVMSPFLARQPEPRGVVLPRGIRKLKALHTLGVVDIEQRKTILQDIRRLTQLRRLHATGINKKNCQDFCLTLSELSCLESLSVSVMEPGLHGCLDGVSSPPKNLKSLHLLGSLVKLPEWTKGLQNLVKLKLRSTRLLELDASIQVIGRLPNLTILCLWQKSFQVEELYLNFQQVVFSSLKVLELALLENLKSVEFGAGAMPKLEQLFFVGRQEKTDIMLFWGLASLQSFKEFLLYNGDYKEDFMEDIRAQLAMNPNGPVLKRY